MRYDFDDGKLDISLLPWRLHSTNWRDIKATSLVGMSCLDPGRQLIAYSISWQSVALFILEPEKRRKGKIY